jgi:hypothetical protein
MRPSSRFPSPRRPGVRSGLILSLVSLALVSLAPPAGAVTVSIRSTDGDGTGFNDPKPAVPVGRNPGTTLGAQRMYVFQYAAEVWGLRLQGTVPVVVSASFADLGGTSVSALLGYARASTLHRDFPRATVSKTWYVAALANQLYGEDQNDLVPGDCPVDLISGACPEIESAFNGSVDNAEVLGAVNFYYGLDGNSGGDIDFLSVVLHEIGHGLGVLGLINPVTGAKFFDYDDAYIRHLEDPFVNPKQVPRMSDLQRQVAVVDDGALVWTGASVMAASNRLNAGRRKDGAVQIYAPTTWRSGSSLSHFDTDLSPNELMEPFINTPAAHDLTLTLAMLKDIGWKTNPKPACGDANIDGKISSADALLALRRAVGLGSCTPVLCDVTAPGGVTSSDALLLLRRAVSLSVTLSCPLS